MKPRPLHQHLTKHKASETHKSCVYSQIMNKHSLCDLVQGTRDA